MRAEEVHGLSEPSERLMRFRGRQTDKPDDAASILLSGKAQSEARRAAIARLGHPSMLCNTAWRYEAPLDRTVWRRAGLPRDMGTFFWLLFLRVQEK